MNKLAKSIFCAAVIALFWIPVQVSAQLTLDDYAKGHYVKVLKTPEAIDIHYAALGPNNPLGAARQTVFQISSNPFAQSSTLDIGKGICIVDAGFFDPSALSISYGFSLSGVEVPLSLDLGAYSGFRLNFAGVSTSESLYVAITVFPHSGGYDDAVVVLPPNGNAFSVAFPFSGFTNGVGGGALTQADVSDIDFIVIETGGGGFVSFGITSFQAVN
jgi:hypothetical protein